MKNAKFEAAVHYVIDRCKNDPSRLGSTRLNKALWHADVLAYKMGGESITGAQYEKRQNGPVPRDILRILDGLKVDEKVHVSEPEFPFEPRRLVSLESATSSHFSNMEVHYIEHAIKYVLNQTASEASEETHDIVWESAMVGEQIPLSSTLASNIGAVTEEVVDWAKKSIEASN